MDEQKGAALRTSVVQLLRYGLIGLVTNAAGYLVYLLATYLGARPTVTMSVLYFLGAVLGFWGNKRLTFAHKGDVLASGLRYAIAHAIGYVINLSLLLVFVDRFGYAHQWVQGVAIFVVAAYIFLAFKFFVFKDLDMKREERQ